ncbi:MAG: pilus assembly protein MshP [Desulfuromonadales bacterium]|nr:pilus assembly protein MshP [Desulfuromonadales bacterium]MDW7758792.1 pilus assembly protein MshP [Desulfuromonadales bacterium]
MSMMTRSRNQKGYTLVNALFILVVLAALGAFMVTMSGVQSRTPVLALQGARAYQAAQTGIEWGIAQSAAGVCTASSAFIVEGFAVTLACTATPVSEGTTTYNVYEISALAEMGSYGTPEYVSRRIEARVTGL